MSPEKKSRTPQEVELASLEETIRANKEVIARRKSEPATEENLAIIKRRESELEEQIARAETLKSAMGKVQKAAASKE